MTEWRTFSVKESDFDSKEAYDKYRNLSKCAVCHKKLELGDVFDLRPVQTEAQAGSKDLMAVIVHKKCLEEQ